MACLVQNGTSSNAHLPVHENLSKKRKLASPNHFKNKRVQRIHDTSTSPPWTTLYPGSRLEQEAIQYIHKFYCKDCQMDQQAAERAKASAASGEEPTQAGSEGASSPQSQQPPGLIPEVKEEPPSPMSPQQMTDEVSLVVTLDKNKESLKRKLMMRRSLNELVDQGIYPPPKTPPAFMEQRKSLERAKIGDSLRFKISHRPDRKQLVQQHILEDTNIDPSLHERQRQLKKARLADSLNDKLSHRPGVLELVQGNILQTDGKLTQLIKGIEGSLSFEAAEPEVSNDSMYDDGKSSDEAFSPDQTDDSNLSDVSSPPVIPPAPELPTSFAKSLPFSAQIQFHQDSKVTLPLTTQSFTIPNQTTFAGGFGATTSFVSQRINNNVTVSTINNNNSNKSRPKKPKPKPQPKAKVIKFHEYKGPPNVVKSSLPVSSTLTAVNNLVNSTNILANVQPSQTPQPNDTSYHILLQQQQLFLQWQLEFNQKNPNATTVLVPKDGLSGFQTTISSMASSAASSVAESAPVAVVTQSSPQTVFTVTPTSQHAQPPAQIQQIRISSPVLTPISQEQLGQPQPQMNPNVTPVTSKPPVKRPSVSITPGPPKQYTSLEEMKVAELKAELKKRNLTVSGPKPQLIERLKPYADAILKCPIDKSPSSVTSPSSSILSPTGSLISSRSATSPQSFSVMSPLSAVTSPQTPMMSSKTLLISPPGSVLASSNGTSVSVPVMVTSFTGAFSQPGSVQTNFGGSKSPGSVSSSNGSVTSPTVSTTSASLFSRPGSVMSPLGSVIDETLCNTADSPLPSIQSMQSAVSVSNMALMPDDLSNPFSPPSSPLFMENVVTPLSPDLMDINVQSPSDLRAIKPHVSYQELSSSGTSQQHYTSSGVQNHIEYSNPPSVLSVAPSEVDKHDIAMDIDLDLTQSLSSGLGPTIAAASASATTQLAPPPPPLPTFTNMATASQQNSAIKAQQDDQQQLLDQIQAQLKILQEKQKLNQQQQLQHSSSSSYQVSQEELLKQQQEKIEKLQSQLEESQLRLKLQQLQHQQLQAQQQKLQQLQQQALQNQAAQNQLEQQIQQQQFAAQQQQQQQKHVSAASLQQQQQQQQQVAHSQMTAQSQQPTSFQGHQITIPTHSASVTLQGQPKVSVQSQLHKQITVQGQPHIQLQGQPQTIAQGQPQLALHIPRSSPVIMQAQTSVAQPQPAVSQNQAQQKSPQHSNNQKPVTTTAQVIFSVPTIPNGGKPPTLATLPPNMKQIQIPAHLLQAFQNSQLPAVIVTQNPRAATTKKTRAPNLEFIKNQALNQTMNLGPGRSVIAVSTATGGTQQFIIATAPTAPNTSTNVPQTSTAAPMTLNGLTQPPVQKLTASLPTSPVEGSQRPVARTASNPFFIPMKEPPKYDEAVRNKPNKGTEGNNDSMEKSQTMDDVLEILIRTGELPASAAQEPPSTPKTTSHTQTVPTVSVTQSTRTSLPTTQYENQSVVFSTSTQNGTIVPNLTNSQYSEMKGNIESVSQYSDMKGNIESVYVPMENFISACATSCGIKTEVKMEPCESDTHTSGTLDALPDNSQNSDDFFDLSEMINNDLNAMDWAPDAAFGDMDLTDMTTTSTAMDMMPSDHSFLSIPNAQSPQRSIHGSDQDLTNLGLADMDTNSNMQIDVPDWLDVIMPNTGLTPRSANAPVSFPADPILTPQTQKEVLDLFNFDESDLNTPSDFSSMSAWDKFTEATTH